MAPKSAKKYQRQAKSQKCLKPAVKDEDDIATLVPEESWYNAAENWNEVRAFCKSWNGTQDLNLASLFDHSQVVKKTWEAAGYKCENLDIKTGGLKHDFLSKDGFYTGLDMLMRLKDIPGEAASVSAPPCSNMGFMSSSVHLRHEFGPEGNTKLKSVRMSNLISSNLAVALKAQLKFRPWTDAMVEQPKGSWMYKRTVFEDIIKGFKLRKTLTYQGLFGGDLEKPTHILHTLADDKHVARRMTKVNKAMFRKRIDKKVNAGTMKEYYKVTSNGGVQGTKHLQSSATYPKRFASALLKMWKAGR